METGRVVIEETATSWRETRQSSGRICGKGYKSMMES